MVDPKQFASSSDFFIVGIGASAGGVQALEAFFANVPDNPNAAFVVVQHLSPNYRSMMTEILQRQTAMRVQEVQHQASLKPGNVYVLTPRKSIVIQERRLHLTDKADGLDYPIDRFFASLPKGWGERIIAILLSGTGKDGTEGLQAVSRAGGIALVQSPETAQFISMPTNAIPSGLVDEVLSPADLAKTVFELIRFSENFPNATVAEASLINPDQLQQILDVLADREDIDFSHYKISTLSRRIYHRCALTRQHNLAAYLHLLKQSEDEQKLLRQDLLIGATAFFRDPEAWNVLEQQVLPGLIESLDNGQPLRIWVSACATGEEAYSMAILVDEAVQRYNKELHIKIFATDLDSNALEVAAQGIYSESITASITPERLQTYFNFEGGQYHVKRSLRAMLTIAPHDLTKNAGFSKMNLVSCRNVLIYMQPQLQQQVLRLLHFALAPEGVLFLGSSETLGSIESEFKLLSQKWRLFSKRRDTQLSILPFVRQSVAAPLRSSGREKTRDSHLNRLLGEVFRYSLGDRQVTCLLVNHDNRLLRVFYNAADLLEFPLGEPLLDITKVVHPALRLPLGTALHRAKRDQSSVLYSDIKIDRDGEDLLVNLRVGLDQSNPTTTETLLIVVLEVEQPSRQMTDVELSDRHQFDIDGATVQQIAELEYELQQTRENLQVTIEELETTNEEQQATNEELLASNEELQSTNEELQSVNEELYTVNAEYQAKIQELTQLNNDIDNLLRSIDIGVVFLDRDLNIRKFTPAVAQSINIKPTDIGRPLADLTNNLNLPDLLRLVQSVAETGEPMEREASLMTHGKHLLMRINPYLREGDSPDGVVVTFINIDELKQVQSRLERTNATLENLYAFSPVGLGLLDDQLHLVRVNQTLANINGDSINAHQCRPLREMLPTLANRLEPDLNQVLETGRAIEQLEVRGATADTPDRECTWLVSLYRVEFDQGRWGVGIVVVDVTQRVEAERAIRERERELARQKEALEEAISVAQTADAANQSKSDFLSNISHELRTPLNSILGVQQLLAKTDVVAQHPRLLQMLKTNGEQLLNLVNDILDLSKIESRRLTLESRQFSLSMLVRMIHNNFEVQIQRKQLDFAIAVDDTIPDQLVGDDFRLIQVLNNLISNAIKFTEQGRVTLTISPVSAEPRDREAATVLRLKFMVSDTGIGISATDKDDLFQPFIQADNSTTRQYGGTGLGLTICRRIVELMDGEIDVDSTPGAGSHFWFTVPLGVAAIAAASPQAQSLPAAELPTAPSSRRASALTILIVEDYADNRDLLQLMLEDCQFDYTVDYVENGQEALDRLEPDPVDIVLMDCQMPVLDGYDATRQLRQRFGTQDYPIVIGITAHAMPEDREKCLQAGMNDYLQKPLAAETLIETLTHWYNVLLNRFEQEH